MKKMNNKATGLGSLPQSNIFNDVPDFTTVPHTRENSAANEAHLNANRHHFRGQCALVYSLFMKGVVLSTRTAQLHYQIGDLRRRVKDLKDEGGMQIDEQFEFDKSGKRTRYKIWFIREALTEATAVKYKIEWKRKNNKQ